MLWHGASLALEDAWKAIRKTFAEACRNGHWLESMRTGGWHHSYPYLGTQMNEIAPFAFEFLGRA